RRADPVEERLDHLTLALVAELVSGAECRGQVLARDIGASHRAVIPRPAAAVRRFETAWDPRAASGRASQRNRTNVSTGSAIMSVDDDARTQDPRGGAND